MAVKRKTTKRITSRQRRVSHNQFDLFCDNANDGASMITEAPICKYGFAVRR